MIAVSSAYEIIAFAGLSRTERLLLNQFVKAAVDPKAAARYLISRTTGVEQDVETSLRYFTREWRGLVEILL
ncbi:hypothetical protein BDV39DRAFT_176490 [Aspergillus sergii]|uniref:Uncharacterized protein n=1 Tax=Aspergillus sergii TaxID=1034303 RepID=A0A5N6X0J7_9EURO|nr:hypothetical protein BDV39DRAFT_176490 [Aspergillus sergii]